jgi:hypothetical protein
MFALGLVMAITVEEVYEDGVLKPAATVLLRSVTKRVPGQGESSCGSGPFVQHGGGLY